MDAAGDPDPDGWPIHPAVAFYGLWPRFAAAGAGEEDAAASASAAARAEGY